MIEPFVAQAILVTTGAVIVVAWIVSYGHWLTTHKRLHIRVQKLDDGRYRVRYYWSVWEDHVEYVSAELLPAFLSDLVLTRG